MGGRGSFKSVKKLGELCPVCGKDDYCGYPSGINDGWIYCNRTTGGYKLKDVVMGATGEDFIALKQGESDPEKFTWRRLSEYEAFLADIKREKNGEHVKRKVKKRKKVEREHVPVPQIADDDRLHEYYSTFLSLLEFEDFHFKHFVDEKWPRKLLEWLDLKSMVRSLPPSDGAVWYATKTLKEGARGEEAEKLKFMTSFKQSRDAVILETIKRVGEPVGIPGFYKKRTNRGEKWVFAAGGGIVLPMRSKEKKIVALNIKADFPGEGPKYYWASSWQVDYDKETGKAKIKYPHGTPVDMRVHVQYPQVIGDTMVIKVTEGWKKAVVSAELTGQITIAIPGVNNLADLYEVIMWLVNKYEVKYVIIALDADKTINKNVLQAESRLKVELYKLGVRIGISSWEMVYGKGLDDCLLGGHKETYEIAKFSKEEKERIQEA